MTKKHHRARETAQRRIGEIRQAITEMDLVCAGTLSRRMRRCGKPNCRCARDPVALHGPYYEWTRWEKKRLAHTNIPPDQVAALQRAIRNHRSIRKLLARWQRQSVRLILNPEEHKP